MRILVISDLHGNQSALNAFLELADRERPDQIICLGDIGDPLPGSLEVWQTLKRRAILTLRGNHEDYTIEYWKDPSSKRWQEANWRGITPVARHFGPQTAEEFSRLAFSLELKGGAHFFHGSPLANNRSFYDGIDESMAAALHATSAKLIVSGHKHVQWHRRWNGIDLLSIGSLGIPLHGKNEAEFLELTLNSQGWRFLHRSVPFDVEYILNDYKRSGWLDEGAPLSWLLFDELWIAERRVGPLMRKIAPIRHLMKNDQDWHREIKTYLEGLGRWDAIHQKIKSLQ